MVILSGIILVFLFIPRAEAQSLKKVIQLTGLVVGGDSMYGVPAVMVYVPKTGRGTSTNEVGYFSMPTLTGDSVVIRALGYKEKSMIVPYTDDDKLSLIIQLEEDTLMLPEVEIFPYPTEALFKEAFLALKLPEQNDLNNMQSNLNERIMDRIRFNTGNDGSLNHTYFMNSQVQRIENKNYYPTVPLLNPFAWAKFIKQVKEGGLKNKDYDRMD